MSRTVFGAPQHWMDVIAKPCDNLMLWQPQRNHRGVTCGGVLFSGRIDVKKATGTFEVNIAALPQYNTSEVAKLARMSIDKQFHGDLVGTSQGEMLSAGTGTKGSAGYVAIERVTGTLNDRRGSFILQHNATTTRGVPYLNIVVIPDSGTEEFTGITGTMHIAIDKGNHSYEFEYSFSDGT